VLVSHNAEVIDYLAADSAFVVKRPGGGHARVEPLAVDRTSGLRASELMARGLWDTP
jgi:hypothetical protein